MRRAIIIAILLRFVIGPALATNRMDVKVRQGDNPDVDTIWAGLPASFDFYFENDEEITYIGTGLNVYSDDDAGWIWTRDSFHIGSYGDTVWEYLLVEPGSRMHPPDEIWDMQSFGTYANDMDGSSLDDFAMGGVSYIEPHMSIGELDHCLTMRFTALTPPEDEVLTICIDTGQVRNSSPYEQFWNGIYTGNLLPEYWEIGERCWPVKEPPILCGDANFDGDVNVGDAVFSINYVFKNGSAPLMLCNADTNGDDVVNVGDVVWLINFVFKSGFAPVPCCD